MPDVYASIESAEEAVQERLADVLMDALVHDRHLVRRLGTLVRAAGWEVVRLRSHMVAAGRLGEDAADALEAEARRRVAAGEFFGHIAYASLIGRRA